LVWGLWLVALVQGALCARFALESYRGHAGMGEMLRPSGEPLPTTAPDVWAYRELDDVAALVPEDADVLLVCGMPAPVAFDFYFLPRSLRVLYRLEREQLVVLPVADDVRAGLGTFFDHLEARERIATPARLARALESCDWVVRFFDVGPLEAEGVELDVVLDRGPVVLSRVRKP
jgi:hypothetical protein